MSFSHIVSIVLVLWGAGAILGNEYGNERQNYVALFQGSGMSSEFHSRNLILSIYYFRIIYRTCISGLMVSK